MGWTVKYSATALKQLKKLDKQVAELITRFLDEKIGGAEDARRFGHALTGELSDYWRYRVGDYRVICQLRDEELIVMVAGVGHRKEIYR